MADNKTNNEVPVITDAAPAASETPQEEGVNISIEQICAAIINTYKTVVVPLDNLVKDYSSKNIAVTQDEETKILTFTLADNPALEDVESEEVESEETSAESE
jgi:hypothetical protein